MTSVPEQLLALEAVGLVREAREALELAYRFRHALVQDAAYGSLLKADRRRLHLVVGEAIERLYPDRAGELAALLAHHFDEAGATARALVYYISAGDMAAAQYANVEAVVQYSRVLALSKDLPGALDAVQLLHVYTQLGRALELSARHAEAMQVYTAMVAEAARLDVPALELAGLSAQATLLSTPSSQHDPERGLELATRAYHLAQALGDRAAEARMCWCLMQAYLNLGRYDLALAQGECSLALARELGLREQLAFTLNDISRLYIDPRKSLAALGEARLLWRALGNAPMLGDNLTSAAYNHYVLGEVLEAQAVLAEALSVNRAIGNLWGEAYNSTATAMMNLEWGRLDEVFRAGQVAVQVGEASGFGYPRANGRAQLALAYGLCGQFERAWVLADEALAAAERHMPRNVPLIRQVRARLHLYRGELLAAGEELRAGGYVGVEAPESGVAPLVMVGLEWQTRIGDAGPVRARVTRWLEESLTPEDHGFMGAGLWRVRALACAAEGDLEAAWAAWERAWALGEHIQQRRFLLLSAHEMAALAEQRGDAVAAAAVRVRGREVLMYFLAHLSDAELRLGLLAQPFVRALEQAAETA